MKTFFFFFFFFFFLEIASPRAFLSMASRVSVLGKAVLGLGLGGFRGGDGGDASPPTSLKVTILAEKSALILNNSAPSRDASPPTDLNVTNPPEKSVSILAKTFFFFFFFFFFWRPPDFVCPWSLKTFFFFFFFFFFFWSLEHSCPWPRECLSSERLSLALALASDFFCVLGLGLEPCVLDSTSAKGQNLWYFP